MSVLKVQRKPTEANLKLDFQFDNPGLEFLVKNFTDGDIYVGVEAIKERMILILAETAQVVVCMTTQGCDTLYVIPTAVSEKGVEVQCLRW